MGLAASQARLLTITSRKSDCEFLSMRYSHQKIALSRNMTDISNEYQNSLNQTKLVYDYYGTGDTSTPLSYNLLMTPSQLNGYMPTILTDTANRVVLDTNYAFAAQMAGIPQEGLGTLPSSDVRNRFIQGLAAAGLITNEQANIYQSIQYSQDIGLGTTDLVAVSVEEMTYDELVNYLSTQSNGSDIFMADLGGIGKNGNSGFTNNGNTIAGSFSLADILSGDVVMYALSHDNGDFNSSGKIEGDGESEQACSSGRAGAADLQDKTFENLAAMSYSEIEGKGWAGWNKIFDEFENLLNTGEANVIAALDYAKTSTMKLINFANKNDVGYKEVEGMPSYTYIPDVAPNNNCENGWYVSLNTNNFRDDIDKHCAYLKENGTGFGGFDEISPVTGNGGNNGFRGQTQATQESNVINTINTNASQYIGFYGYRVMAMAGSVENDPYMSNRDQEYLGTDAGYSNCGLAISVSNVAKAYLTYFVDYLDKSAAAYVDDSAVTVNGVTCQYRGAGYNLAYKNISGARTVEDSNLIDKNKKFKFNIVTNRDINSDQALISGFYDALFNQICTKGWVANPNVQDNEYMQELVKSGKCFISTCSDDGYYYQGNYSTNSFIKEVSDEEAIAQAEAKYNTEKQKINYKEEIIDLKMKNLDTEISSLTTEYDTVKSLISKNIEKSFKRYEA